MEFEEFNKAASKCKVYNCISNLYNIYFSGNYIDKFFRYLK